MNELQECEFNILKALYAVCNELGIKCFLVCGSALGAVKYGGFIPWDDDIDVGIFREDYELFLREAPKRLPQKYFLQNYRTDAYFPFVYSKVRDSETTYIEKNVSHINMNHGVYVDVFPLDGYPLSIKKQKILEKKKRLYKIRSECNISFPRSKKLDLFNKFLRFMGDTKRTQKIVDKYDKMISAFSTTETELICNHGNWQGMLEYSPKSCYGNGKEMFFEGLRVYVPEKYDEYLSQKYGNWTAELPRELQVGHHYYEVMDLKKPYSNYIRVISDKSIEVKR